ncbi:unnamed protein product, partial [marine sediment metagenome]
VKDLGVTYGGYSCFIRLKFVRKGSNESKVFIIHAWHGAGASQTDGARLQRLTRLMGKMEADVYLMGHLHAITHIVVDRLKTVQGKIKSIPQIATITGSWLRTYAQGKPPCYGEEAGYSPSHIGCPTIIFNPFKDEIHYMV